MRSKKLLTASLAAVLAATSTSIVAFADAEKIITIAGVTYGNASLIETSGTYTVDASADTADLVITLGGAGTYITDVTDATNAFITLYVDNGETIDASNKTITFSNFEATTEGTEIKITLQSYIIQNGSILVDGAPVTMTITVKKAAATQEPGATTRTKLLLTLQLQLHLNKRLLV